MKKSSNIKTLLLTLLVMALWGSLFPFVKIGYNTFGINSESIPDIIMFAGMRFMVCGAVLCVISTARKETLASPKMKNISIIMLAGLFSIILHYTFTYIGLSLTDSSKTALLKQLGQLLYVCFAFLFVRSEKFSILKIAGAVTGFLGIIAINLGSGGVVFSTGDILIILASVCTVISSIITQITVKENSPFWSTGISQLFGGIVLLLAAVIMGADMLNFNVKSTLAFLYICTASTVAYTLYGYILRTSSLSKLFIIKFTEPLFACIFGAILLGENILKWQYLAAFVLISAGIIIGNKEKGVRSDNEANQQ